MGLAEEFARRGAVLAAQRPRRRPAGGDRRACRAHGATVHELVADLGDQRMPSTGWPTDALHALGGVDMLVNNAGIPKRRKRAELDAATVDTVMQVNFLGPTRLTLALLPQMIDRGEGRIVNVSSVAATLSSPGESAYDASKAALVGVLRGDGDRPLGRRRQGAGRVPRRGRHATVHACPTTTRSPHRSSSSPSASSSRATFDALDRDALEVYIPEYFKDIRHREGQQRRGLRRGIRRVHAPAADAGRLT